MASRSGTANGANRDVERAYGSGRRAKRYEARFVCDRVRDGVRAYGSGRRACLRIGTTSDTVRARTASERSCRAMRLHAGLPLATGVRRAFKVSTLAFHAVDN